MQAKDGFFWHRIFLCALFILGNAIITIPLTNENGVLGVIDFSVAGIIGFILAATISLIAKKLKNKSTNSILKWVLLGIWLIFLLSILFDCCRDYVIFTDTTKMPNSSAIVIAVAFLALSFYCGYQRRSVLFRASVICFLLCCLILAVLVILSLPRISVSNIYINYTQNGLTQILLKAFLPSIAAYYFVNIDAKGMCASLLGTLFGSIILLICGVLCIMVLGKTLNLIDYPLAMVGGIVSIGKGFMRFEGFVYLIIMLTSFIKASVIIHLILNIFNKNKANHP